MAYNSLKVDTTQSSDMTKPAVNILHTGPAEGNVYADLMVLSGFKNAPYGFRFRTYGDGTGIIQAQRINSTSEWFPLSLNPSGGNVLINGVKAATVNDIPKTYAGSTSAGGAANSVANSITFKSDGSGAASGTTFNGSAARIISYNTIGAAPQSVIDNAIQLDLSNYATKANLNNYATKADLNNINVSAPIYRHTIKLSTPNYYTLKCCIYSSSSAAITTLREFCSMASTGVAFALSITGTTYGIGAIDEISTSSFYFISSTNGGERIQVTSATISDTVTQV